MRNHPQNPSHPSRIAGTAPLSPQAAIDRKVRALLNKLTLTKFDSISDQIIGHVQSEHSDLEHIVELVFVHAVTFFDERFTQLYARLCRKIVDSAHAQVNVAAEGQLFRERLLRRCEEEYARVLDGERRLRLGFIRFYGELFKLDMITDRTVHECVKTILGTGPVEDKRVEYLCVLFTTVGQTLDTTGAGRDYMDGYFARLKEIWTSPSELSGLRLRFMVQVRVRALI